MNPLTKVKLISELNKKEAELGIQEKVSWHAEYQDSAWIFLGGLPYELTEGDIICVFSQYGEIVNINLVREKKSGKSKGFCFLCYEDQRSTILAVDNFNGIKIKGRTIRVDHVANYRPPKESADLDEITKTLHERGCGAKTPPPSSAESSEEEQQEIPRKKHKKDKKEKKKKKEKKRVKSEKLVAGDEYVSNSKMHDALQEFRIKEEKDDGSYDKYASTSQARSGSSHSQKARENWNESKESVDRKDFRSSHRGSVNEGTREQQREEQKDYQRNDRCRDPREQQKSDHRNSKGQLDGRTEEDRKNASSSSSNHREEERSRKVEKSKEVQREKYEKSGLHSSRQGDSFSSKSHSSSSSRERSGASRKDHHY